MTDGKDEFVPTVGGASGLVVVDGKVLLIRRGKEPYKGYWSLPGGGIEPGEGIRETVKREMLEETGLEVEVGLVAGFREYVRPNDYYIIPAFFCTVMGGELRAGDDAAEAEFVNPKALGDRLTVPTLEDVFRDAGLLD